MRNQDQFAFGTDAVEDDEGNLRSCPTVAAGLSTKDPNGSVVAGKFDEEVRPDDSYKGEEEARGIVDEETAKEVWLDIVDHFQEYEYPEKADFAEEVAYQLGWLEGDRDE